MSTPHEEYRKAIVELATLHGWRCQWHWKSIHSPKGFPDLVMVRARTKTNPFCARIIFAELKAGRDKLTPAQTEWIDDLRAVELRDNRIHAMLGAEDATPVIQVFVWRRETNTLEKLEEVLR